MPPWEQERPQDGQQPQGQQPYGPPPWAAPGPGWQQLAGLTGDGDAATWLLSLGPPVGGVLLAGGISLLGRRRADWVLWSAVAAVVVLVLAALGAALSLDSDDAAVVLVLVVLALPLPVVTAALSVRAPVRQWAAATDQR